MLSQSADLLVALGVLSAYAFGAFACLFLGRFLIDLAHEALTGTPLQSNKERRSGTGRYGA